MNFSDLRFWSTLFWALGAWLVLRSLSKRWWPAWGDAVGLLATSLWLFAEASERSLTLFLLDLAANAGLARAIARAPMHQSKRLLTAGIIGNLALLSYFKYRHFLLGDVLGMAAYGDPDAIPPGISFYTFQMIGYLVDTRRAKHRGESSGPRPLDFFNFVSFFPHIVAGPIQRRSDLMPQMVDFRFRGRLDSIAEGVRWCVLGLFSKMFLADSLAGFVKDGPTQSAYVVIWSTFLFGLRIYFDFAGYSFIAIGLAHFLGVRLSDNFLAPYSSRSVREFWQRWHVTLGTWFRDYLYFPLGGNKVAHWWANLLVVFLLSGLWHGASWNFVLWGAYHGVLLLGHRFIEGRIHVGDTTSRWCTLILVFAGWLLFMDVEVATLWSDLDVLVTRSSFTIEKLSMALPTSRGQQLTLAVVLVLSGLFLAAEGKTAQSPYRRHLSLPATLAMSFFTVVGVGHRSAEFIYFAF